MTSTTHSIITDGYISSNNSLIITDGYNSAPNYLENFFARLEQTSVSTVLIDYTCIHEGLADWTPLDKMFERLES